MSGTGAVVAVSAAMFLVAGLAGCSTAAGQPAATSGGSRVVKVVAAENFWGSIAAQLGGRHATVTSIIDSPSADPHEYEVTAADARHVAAAGLVLVNGIGYDTWATQLVAADPAPGRRVLDVGQLIGVAAGGNPHRWYDPAAVARVVAALTADYRALDPADADYFDQQRNAFEGTATAAYKAVVAGSGRRTRVPRSGHPKASSRWSRRPSGSIS